VPTYCVNPLPGGPEESYIEFVSIQDTIIGTFKALIRGGKDGHFDNLQWWDDTVYYFQLWYTWLTSLVLLAGAGVGGFFLCGYF